jgi:hypothetical protein
MTGAARSMSNHRRGIGCALLVLMALPAIATASPGSLTTERVAQAQAAAAARQLRSATVRSCTACAAGSFHTAPPPHGAASAASAAHAASLTSQALGAVRSARIDGTARLRGPHPSGAAAIGGPANAGSPRMRGTAAIDGRMVRHVLR